MSAKSIIVSFLGKPNAGKSTLLNRLIGQKLSIVTPKVQTTRTQLKAVMMHKNNQLVFIDTPGIFKAKQKLEKAMVRNAWSSIVGSDLVCLLIDAKKGFDEELTEIINHLKEQNIKPICLVNKIDKANTNQLTTIKAQLNAFQFKEIFYISALNGDNCNKLLDYFADQASFPGLMYDEDTLTTAPMRFLASEIVREKLFLNLRQELPYQLTVETETWQEMTENEVKINMLVFVTRDAYKKIILGRNGEMIKKIGTQARIDIEKNLDIKTHLFIFVKVRGNWQDNANHYNYLQLNIKDSK